MTKRLSEWARARAVALKLVTAVVLSLGGGGAGVYALTGGTGDAQASSVATDVEDCQARVGALEQSLAAQAAANSADHAALLRALAEISSDVREVRGAILRRVEVAR